jgi:pimeloyl-ACP methyl ester carboxylesterase
LAADVNRLLEKLGIEKVILGGGSFGGLVALQFVLDYPRKVEALILSDTTSNSSVVVPFMDMMLPVLSGPNAVETLRKMISKLAKVSGMTKTPVGSMMMENALERFADIDPISLLEVSRGMFNIDFTERLSEIKVPTLIIGGKKDMVIPLKYAEVLHRGISGSECVVIKTDHGTPFFRPDEWNKAVQGFLQRIGH